MRGAAVVVVAILAVALTGCSQASALAPVGGNALSEVRFAANDVLVSKGIGIRTAPSCTSSTSAITCAGGTTTGEPIRVRTTSPDLSTFTVSVGATTLYSGSVDAVLNAAARPTP